DLRDVIQQTSGSSSSEQSTPMAELEGMVPPSVVAQLLEELEASRVEVARLQLMLQGDVACSSAVAEYLRSDAYHRRIEFEQVHHCRS
ncbi:hypothetical protein ACLOJK_036397, partial [Asimina triloba]